MADWIGDIRKERHGHILKMVVDNADKKNAFSPEMVYQLSEHLTELENDPDLWVGVLCAEGPIFTSGLDMPRFFGPGATAREIPADMVDPFGLGKIGTKPLITAVQGMTWTHGIELALAGDIVIAAEDAIFCQMESKRGIAPLGGAHFRYISRAGWGNAMYHLFLCDEFDAREAHRVGIVQEVVPAGTQIDRAMEIAALIAKNAPLGIQATKVAGRKFIDQGEQASIAAMPELRNRVFRSADMMEGIQSFMERREANFQGR